jgi:hypothetical protein
MLFPFFPLINQHLSKCKKLKCTKLDVMEFHNALVKFCVNRGVTSELKDDTCRHHDLVKLYFSSSKKIM